MNAKQRLIDGLTEALRRIERETRGYDPMSMIGGISRIAAEALLLAHAEARGEDADATIKAECERRFQSGSTRTLIVSADGRKVQSADSAPRALRYADAGDRVFSRRKINGSYTWVCMNKAARSQA